MSDFRPVAGQSYELPVVDSDENYFTVHADPDYNFKIRKLAFQAGVEPPATILCRVMEVRNGYPIVRQDLIPVINRFYTEGQEYDFRVKSDFTNRHNGYYEVEDDKGLFFHLYVDRSLALEKGRVVRCRFQRLRGMAYKLKLGGTLHDSRGLAFWSLDSVLAAISDPLARKRLRYVYDHTPELEPLHEKIEALDPEWPFLMLDIVAANIPVWLGRSRQMIEKNRGRARALLADLQQIALFLLEDSEFLKNCQGDDRMSRRRTLSAHVESIKNYSRASELIANHEHEAYIDMMLSRLRRSGYLYHPMKQFTILMTIFRICPELITQRMGQIFDTISDWDIENWRMEPFRSAFVEQLEMYISMKAPEINRMPQIESKEDNLAVGRIVTAIAIQVLIGNRQCDNVNFSRNRSMFYRYLAMVNRPARDILLDKALQTALGCQTACEFTWYDIRQFTLMMTKSSNPNSSLRLDKDTNKSFSGNGIRIDISADGIILSNASAPRLGAVPRLPNGITSRFNIQVSLHDDIRTISRSKMRNLDEYRKMWSDIERQLTSDRTERRSDVRKEIPDVGDYAEIYVDDIDETGAYFHCVIDDEHYEGSGWIALSDIVKYRVDAIPEYFQDPETGEPLRFIAEVIKTGDGNDDLTFSMADLIHDFLTDEVSYYDDIACVVTEVTPYHYTCLTRSGYSMRVKRTPEYDSLLPGSLFWGHPGNSMPDRNMFYGEIVSLDGVPKFDRDGAFKNLMHLYGRLHESADEENEEIYQADDVVSADELSEVIEILRRVAFETPDYVESYNYLAFASLMAMALEGAGSRIRELCANQMAMLIQLQYYSANRRIDPYELEKLRVIADDAPVLQRLFTRLEIVNALGKEEYDGFLWEIFKRDRNEFESRLARLALSYNMLGSDDQLSDQRKAIINSIGEMLNVNRQERNLKYYGDGETKTLEFKTSLVYPAGKEFRMQPNVQVQEQEILQIICGFLNAAGGTLYIGVNDQGYESGLANDLAYYGVTLSQLALRLDNLVSQRLGSQASDCVNVAPDTGTNYPVLSVTIRPCRHVVELDGTIYVRQSSSTRPKLGADREMFITDRPAEYEAMIGFMRRLEMKENVADDYDSASVDDGKISDSSDEQVTSSVVPRCDAIMPEREPHRVKTSRSRLNILREAIDPERFVEPAGYLHLTPSMKLKYVALDTYEEGENILTIALREDDIDRSLVILYSDGSANRVVISRLTEAEFIEHDLAADKTPVFIAPADEDDALAIVLANQRGDIYYRAGSVAAIPEGRLDASGCAIVDAVFTAIEDAEILPESSLSMFDKGLKVKPRSLGYSIQSNNHRYDYRDDIERLFAPVRVC